MNVFAKVVTGLKWVGKDIAKVFVWGPKIIKITEDVEGDAHTLLPQAVQVFTDVDVLVIAAVKDSAQDLSALNVLVLSIEQAAQASGIDVAKDEAVLAAFEGLVKQIGTKSTYTDVLSAMAKLVTDWDAFGASAKTALEKIKADA